MSTLTGVTGKRSDAARNRERILQAAQVILSDRSRDVSMAQVAREAGVGMGTLYRNFAGLRDVLEALYADEVDELVKSAGAPAASAGEALVSWLRRFALFHENKHSIATELLRYTDRSDPFFDSSRDRVLAAGQPLLAAAQRAGGARDGVRIEQVLDLILSVLTIEGGRDYLAPILDCALDGIAGFSR